VLMLQGVVEETIDVS